MYNENINPNIIFTESWTEKGFCCDIKTIKIPEFGWTEISDKKIINENSWKEN